MCMQDWRVGRLIRTSPHPESGNVVNLTVAPNRNRVGIYISAPGLNDPVLGFIPADIQILLGGVVAAYAIGGIMVSLATHGDLCQRGFSVIDNSNGASISAVEFFMPEEYLAAGLESFRSNYKWPPT